MQLDEIHKKAVFCARRWHESETDLVEILQVVNQEMVYKKMGYSSLFSYAVEALEIPASQVYRFNGVAKSCNAVPEVKRALASGKLSVSQISRLVPVINLENASLWIDKALNTPQKQLEKEIATHSPKTAPPEKAKPINAAETTITVTLTHEAAEALNRLKDLFSQKTGKSCQLKEVIEQLAFQEIKRKDPLQIAQRNRNKKAKEKSTKSTARVNSSRRQPLSARVKHEVMLRDRAQCRFHVAGKRCTSKRWLDVHHLIPVAYGGTNASENLITLCRFHHRFHHERVTRLN